MTEQETSNNDFVSPEELGQIANISGKISGKFRKQSKELSELSESDYDQVCFTELQSEKFKELREIIERIENRKPDEFTIPEFGKQYKIDYKKELNEEQLQAVVTTEGPLLVIAGAGTGKTRVLSYRVLYLIESGVIPSDILILTFTRKAAKEMIGRVNISRKDSKGGDVSGGTFHSLAVRLIRQYHTYFHIPPYFTIADVGKSESIIDLARTELELDKRKLEFPAKKRIFDIISTSKNTQVSIEDVIKKDFTGLEKHITNIEKVNDWYQKYKKAANIFDFDDLMIVLRDKLKGDDEFRKKIQAKYKYIMIDEYQDTNLIQKELADLMANDSKNIMVVGDDAQSIYQFRGANYENILRFPETYPGGKIVKLTKNYRSLQKLIDFTNSVNNSFLIGYKKHLASIRKGKSKKPKVLKFVTQEDEAKFIVDRIFDLHENNVPYSEMAVLCRNAWFWTEVEKELIKRKIPYVTVGGVKFLQKKHIQDVIAYLSVIHNPYDPVAWHHILILEPRVGKKRASSLVVDIRNKNGNLDLIEPTHPKKVRSLVEVIQKASSDKFNLEDKIDQIVAYYTPILMANDDKAGKSLSDLIVFKSLSSGYKDIAEFLSEMAIDGFAQEFENGISPSIDETEEKPVTLSTIHSAKGLEWAHVFIPHSLDGLLPSTRDLNDIEELEEENRLFYVATTRAKDSLHITMPSTISANRGFWSLSSRFLIKVDKGTYKYATKANRINELEL